MPVNIVLFTASYAPRVGGLETAVARLAREFQNAGHHVTVVTNRYPRHLARFEHIEGVPVHRILFPAPYVPASEWGRTHVGKVLLLLPLAPASLLRLWLLLRSLRPDVVNVHYLSSAAVYVAVLARLRLLRTPLVISCHGSDLTTVPYPTGSKLLSRWVVSHAGAVTACSADLARYIAMMTDHIPGGAARVVYNGTDVEEFADAVPHLHPRPYILGAGRLTEKKGFHFLIEAVALLRDRGIDCDLIIAGSGPEESWLRALADRLGLAQNVHFEGMAGRARLAALYHGCALFALSPVWEGFGIVSLEAMSCARAVVATRTGGIPEVVLDGETGLLARPADPTDLADKLAELLADPMRAGEMGRRGRARVLEQFTWPIVARRYLASYTAASLRGNGYQEKPPGHCRDATILGPPAVLVTEPAEAAVRPEGAVTDRSAGVSPVPPMCSGMGAPRREPNALRYPTSSRADQSRTLAHRERHADGVPILTYHQVAPASADGVKPSLLVTPRAFARQMRLLHALGWRTVRLVDLLSMLDTMPALPPRRFVLTFDDALVGVARHAAPILADLGFTATIFVPTQFVGTCRALDGGPDHPAKSIMTWDDLGRLKAAGFDVGAHSRSHPHLNRLGLDEMRAEIAGSRDDIMAALGEPPAVFAYPYGEWSPAVAAAVHESGFVGACATQFGRATAGAPRFALPRISVSSELDLPHFAYRVARADRIARRMASGDGSDPGWVRGGGVRGGS